MLFFHLFGLYFKRFLACGQALHERGEIESAHKELQGLIRIHENFSPNRNSVRSFDVALRFH